MVKIVRSGLLALIAAMAVAMPAAASSDILYLNVTKGAVTAGSTVTVEIRVNSGSQPVNAVQANLDFDASKLQYVSVDGSGSAFPLAASTLPGAGSLKLARATAGGTPPASGDVLFANVKFKSLAAASGATVTIGAGSHVVRSTDSTDLLPAAAGSATATPVATVSPSPAATQSGFLGLNSGALLAGLGVAAGVVVIFAVILHFLLPRISRTSSSQASDINPTVVLPTDKPDNDKH